MPSFCFSEPSRGGLPAVFLIFVLLLNLSVLELQDRNWWMDFSREQNLWLLGTITLPPPCLKCEMLLVWCNGIQNSSTFVYPNSLQNIFLKVLGIMQKHFKKCEMSVCPVYTQQWFSPWTLPWMPFSLHFFLNYYYFFFYLNWDVTVKWSGWQICKKLKSWRGHTHSNINVLEGVNEVLLVF